MSDPALPPGDIPHDVPPVEAEVTRASVENPPWTFWDVLRILVVALITIGLFSMVAMAIAGHGIHSRTVLEGLARDPRIDIPAQAAAYLVVIAYMVAIVRLVGRPFWSTVKWNFPGRNAIAFGTLGIALAILVQTASALLPIPKSLPIDRYFTTPAGAYLMAIFGTTFAPLVEELFFRGFLYPVIARKWGVAASVAVTALVFALVHESQLAHAWAPLFLLWCVGLVLTGVRARTGSVGAGFCIHVGYNFTLFFMLFLASGHFHHLDKLT